MLSNKPLAIVHILPRVGEEDALPLAFALRLDDEDLVFKLNLLLNNGFAFHRLLINPFPTIYSQIQIYLIRRFFLRRCLFSVLLTSCFLFVCRCCTLKVIFLAAAVLVREILVLLFLLWLLKEFFTKVVHFIWKDVSYWKEIVSIGEFSTHEHQVLSKSVLVRYYVNAWPLAYSLIWLELIERLGLYREVIPEYVKLVWAGWSNRDLLCKWKTI